MPKKLNRAKELNKKFNDHMTGWLESFVYDNSRPPSKEESEKEAELYLELKLIGAHRDSVITWFAASKHEGWQRSYTRSVGRGVNGELFDENWARHGIRTPDGPIPNPQATPEHFQMEKEKDERRIERGKEQLSVTNERIVTLEPAFAQNARTAIEALEMLGIKVCDQNGDPLNISDLGKQ